MESLAWSSKDSLYVIWDLLFIFSLFGPTSDILFKPNSTIPHDIS